MPKTERKQGTENPKHRRDGAGTVPAQLLERVVTNEGLDVWRISVDVKTKRGSALDRQYLKVKTRVVRVFHFAPPPDSWLRESEHSQYALLVYHMKS